MGKVFNFSVTCYIEVLRVFYRRAQPLHFLHNSATSQLDFSLHFVCSISKFLELLEEYKEQYPNAATRILNEGFMTVFIPSDEAIKDYFTRSDIANVKKDLTLLKMVRSA